MENLYISSRILNKRNLYFNAGAKQIYKNPNSKEDLIVILHDQLNDPNCEVAKRLEVLYSLSRSHFCQQINLPAKKVYIEDKYVGYTLPYIEDAYDCDLIFSSDMDVSLKLQILRRYAMGVRELHDCGIVSYDLNPTNLLINNANKYYIIDLLDSQFADFKANSYDNRLYYLYRQSFFKRLAPKDIDNVSMHLNLLYALTGMEDMQQFGEERYCKMIRKLKIPKNVKETFLQMRDYNNIEFTPPIDKTIEQIL